MASDDEKTILLTQEAYDKLQEELKWREGEFREEITEKIATARAEGDLSENGGYQAAREEQGKNEGRINELTVKLRSAQILKAPPKGKVGNGSVVSLSIAGNDAVYVLGSREIAVATDHEVISPESPIGAAIMGSKKGDIVTYTAPNGKEITVEIKDSQPLK